MDFQTFIKTLVKNEKNLSIKLVYDLELDKVAYDLNTSTLYSISISEGPKDVLDMNTLRCIIHKDSHTYYKYIPIYFCYQQTMTKLCRIIKEECMTHANKCVNKQWQEVLNKYSKLFK